MNITLTSGLISYTNNDGTTSTINTINVVQTIVLIEHNYSAGAATARPLEVNKPVITPSYKVRVELVNGNYLDIDMASVANQATWVNTLAGANIAVTDITAIY